MTRGWPLLLLALAGCAGGPRTYPSLAPRAAEARGWAEPAITAARVAPDPALDAEIARRRIALSAGGQAFGADQLRAARAVAAARGDAVGGDRWIDAQRALAALDAARAATLGVVGEIEQLALGREQALKPDYPPLSSLAADAEAQLDTQSKRIDELQAAIPTG